MSAVASFSTPGVFPTGMSRSLAASRSMCMTPTPQFEMTLGLSWSISSGPSGGCATVMMPSTPPSSAIASSKFSSVQASGPRISCSDGSKASMTSLAGLSVMIGGRMPSPKPIITCSATASGRRGGGTGRGRQRPRVRRPLPLPTREVGYQERWGGSAAHRDGGLAARGGGSRPRWLKVVPNFAQHRGGMRCAPAAEPTVGSARGRQRAHPRPCGSCPACTSFAAVHYIYGPIKQLGGE